MRFSDSDIVRYPIFARTSSDDGYGPGRSLLGNRELKPSEENPASGRYSFLSFHDFNKPVSHRPVSTPPYRGQSIHGSFADLNRSSTGKTPWTPHVRRRRPRAFLTHKLRSPPMNERLCSRRFDLNLPCLICIAEDEHPEEILRTETLNSSAPTALIFAIGKPLPHDTRMSIEVMVQRSAEESDCHDGSCISLHGRVVAFQCSGNSGAVRSAVSDQPYHPAHCPEPCQDKLDGDADRERPPGNL